MCGTDDRRKIIQSAGRQQQHDLRLCNYGRGMAVFKSYGQRIVYLTAGVIILTMLKKYWVCCTPSSLRAIVHNPTEAYLIKEQQ